MDAHLRWQLLLLLFVLLPRLAAGAPVALSPVIGVIPTSLEFGVLCPGACLELQVSLLNAVNDPQSRLVLSKVVVTPPFTLPHPPPIPTIIPGDGTRVDLFLHYCGEGSGPVTGSLTIHANATNSPLVVPLRGTADPSPNCDAGGAYFGLPNQPITFDGRGSSDPGGAIATYTWDFGDGSTGTGPTPIHSYGTKGTFVVQLAVSDACASATTCQTTAIVSNNALPICDAGGPYAGFTGIPIAMSGAGSSDPDGVIVDYRWNFGDGQTATGVTPSHIYTAPGFYTVTLTVVDDQGAITNCSTTADVNTQGVPNDPPVCDAGGPYRGVVGRPVTFDGSGSSDPDGIVVAYHWAFGDGQTANGATPSHAYATAGNFTISLTVTDNDGASSSCSTRARSIDVSPDFNRPLQKGRPSVSAGLNPMVTLPLHAMPEKQDCSAVSIDCNQHRPTVNIAPDAVHTIFLLAFNHVAVAGVQTAFGWDPGWSLLQASFDCLPGQVTTIVPASPGGATVGTVNTTFDCVNTGQLMVIGRMVVRSGATGCFYQVESDHLNGDHVIDCNLGVDFIPYSQSFRLGRICVGQWGMDACRVIDPDPVQSATWGQIKASYR